MREHQKLVITKVDRRLFTKRQRLDFLDFIFVTGLAYHKHCPEASEPPKTPSYAYTRLILGVVTYFAGSLPQLGLACV